MPRFWVWTQVLIVIIERVAVGQLSRTDGRFDLIDASGVAFHTVPSDAGLPVLKLAAPHPGDPTTTAINPRSMPIGDPTIRTLLSFAPFQRAYWRALEDAVNGPMAAANISGMMNAKYNGLVAAGIPASSPSSALSWIASRRSYIQSQLATVASSSTTPAPAPLI